MTLSTWALLVGIGIGGSGAKLSQAERDEGFVPLLNGRDLTSWHLEGPDAGAFVVAGGELQATRAGNYPTWLRSDRTYENFRLRFDYKVSFRGKCDLVLHAPLHGRRSKVGIQIVITSETVRGAKNQHTGTILGVARERQVVADRHSTWYPLEVLMDYPTLRVVVNGQVVQEVDCEKNAKLRDRLRRGYIGFAATGKDIALRNIRIKELPSKEKWISLLDGIPGITSKDTWVDLEKNGDLGGWHILREARWAVRDRVLRATGNGYLITGDAWKDFELLTYVRASRLANGGIFFRWKGLDTDDRGYEIQIYNNPDGRNPTGSIYGYVRNDTLNVPDDAWFCLQMFVKGKTVRTRVNGDPAACSTDCVEFLRPGRISLQMHGRGCIEWKDLRIKPLD